MKAPAVILMYHALGDFEGASVAAENRPYVLDAGRFEEHLADLNEGGRRVSTVRDWIDAASGFAVPPARAWIILTFDDGDASNHTHALPMLLRAGVKATFFVTVGRIGHPGFLAWDSIRDMHREGMEIGSHTMTHRAPVLLSDDELRYEVMESKKRLEDGLSAEVVSISSPTGFFNRRMSALAREVGYRALCYGRIGIAAARSDPFALPRVPIKRAITDEAFRRIVAPSRSHLARMRGGQMVRNGLKRILGPDAYLRWRRRVLRLGSPE